MIYDIAQANGKEKLMNKELMLGIFLASLGTKGIGVLTMHGSKILVKRTSLRVFQKIVQILGGKILQRAAKAMITKWLPVVGAAAMAVWSRYTTKELGNYAVKILKRDIVQEKDELNDFIDTDQDYKLVSSETKLEVNLDELKVMSLVNLMKIDGEIHTQEIEFIEKIIENIEISETELQKIRANFKTKHIYDIDYLEFKQSPDLSIGLISDLIGLSKRDGKMHLNEKIFIKKVALQLDFSEQDIEEMINSIV